MHAPATQLQPGTTVGGDFQVQTLLSSGGMGAVYVAVQLSTGKPRALKVMHPSFVVDPAMRERFGREARVGAMVPSDHVVEVVGAGVDPQLGVPWLAMELLSGEDLAQHLSRKSRLSITELVEVMRPLCHALGAAHARGIVHRDVKPENVFLAATQSTTHPTVVKVLDFGIARVAADAQATSTTAMGTPMWMAPEQTELKSHVSPASDVWALGLLAFWLLTGRPYWRAGNQGGASVPQLMREILFEPLDPPSARAAEYGVGAAIPAGFDVWFSRCVAREPMARFQNASDAANALFQGVLGSSSAVSIAPPPDPSGASWPVQPASTLESGGALAPQPASGGASGMHSTAVPTVAPATARNKSAFGVVVLAFGLLTLLAGAAVAVGAFFYLADSDDAGTVAVAPSAASSSDAIASAVPVPVAPSSAEVAEAPQPGKPVAVRKPNNAAAGGKSGPTATPPASATPSTAATAGTEKGPYDASAANAAVQMKANWARTACKHHDGPAAIGGQAVFKPSGTVYLVKIPPQQANNSRAGCVRALVLGAIIKPYAGTETHSVGFAVGF